MSNRLADTHSPYLLQHRDNPVDWYPWGTEAFEKARSEDKPIFLSIGYSTCHWCHVMAHESFEDEAVARILNRDFVSIKVDREERPDVDAVYMLACQAMTGSGGWPLTIVMTPDQRPFYAGTYLPKYSSFGRAGLLDTLCYLADVWKRNRAQLERSGDQLSSALRRVANAKSATPDLSLVHDAYHEYRRSFDSKWGGFGSAPKFPSPHNLLFLMDYAHRTGTQDALDLVCRTLDGMAQGGLQDHIGGGFARYSTDSRWLKPHFEKMLYDNALLMLAYTEAYQRTGKEAYSAAACAAAEYVLREMTHPDGGFYSAQDADSEGREGKYYLFTEAELRKALGEKDCEAFLQAYTLTEGIVNRIDVNHQALRPDDPRLIRLREYRANRMSLHRDDKILTAWNAWMLLALARAGCVYHNERYLRAAERAEAFLRTSLTDSDGRLYLCWHNRSRAVPGQLDDYAVYVLACLELYRCTFDAAYLERAICCAKIMLNLFPDTEKGGFFRTAADAEKLIARPKETFDGAMPSGNSCAAMALQQLAELTGETVWLEAAQKQLAFVAGNAKAYGTGVSYGLLAMMRVLFPQRELVCCGDECGETLKTFLSQHPANDLSILWKREENEAALSAAAPFTNAYPVPETGTRWYLCKNGVCKLPESSFDALGLS